MRSRKIIVLGSPGAGKTYFSKKFGKLMGIDVFHLDDYYWKENWKHYTNEDWIDIQKRLLERDSFILDGNYIETIALRAHKSDIIIYINTNIVLCLLRYTKRTLINLITHGSQLPKKIKYQKYTKISEKGYIKFCYYIIKFHIKEKKKLLFWIRELDNKKVYILNHKQVKTILKIIGDKDVNSLFRQISS